MTKKLAQTDLSVQSKSPRYSFDHTCIDEVDSDDSDFNEHEADDYIDIESSEDSNEDINSSQRNFVTRSQTNAGQQINILTTQNPIPVSPLNTTQFDSQESEPNSTQNTENSDLFMIQLV